MTFEQICHRWSKPVAPLVQVFVVAPATSVWTLAVQQLEVEEAFPPTD